MQAHILVCFLGYVLWKTLEQWQKRAGLGNSPRTILDELARINSADIVMPTTDGREPRRLNPRVCPHNVPLPMGRSSVECDADGLALARRARGLYTRCGCGQQLGEQGVFLAHGVVGDHGRPNVTPTLADFVLLRIDLRPPAGPELAENGASGCGARPAHDGRVEGRHKRGNPLGDSA